MVFHILIRCPLIQAHHILVPQPWSVRTSTRRKSTSFSSVVVPPAPVFSGFFPKLEADDIANISPVTPKTKWERAKKWVVGGGIGIASLAGLYQYTGFKGMLGWGLVLLVGGHLLGLGTYAVAYKVGAWREKRAMLKQLLTLEGWKTFLEKDNPLASQGKVDICITENEITIRRKK
jgi:hypothetical protein